MKLCTTTTTTTAPDTFLVERERARDARKLKTVERRKRQSREAQQAAATLGAAGADDLDVRLLLHVLPSDQSVKWVRFVLPWALDGRDREITVSRMALRKLAVEQRHNSRLRDLRASVGAAGLQLRWASGGLNLRHGNTIEPHEAILVVALGQAERKAS